jgi:hypothetical protein
LKEGQAVKKGQIVAWMSSSDRAALLDAARAMSRKFSQRKGRSTNAKECGEKLTVSEGTDLFDELCDLAEEKGIKLEIISADTSDGAQFLAQVIGAAVNTDQEAQQFASVLSVIIIVPYLLGISAIQNPNSTLTTVSSLFPLFTPILMFMRITTALPPLWQIATSIGLSLLTIWGLAWLGAKIFRVGMLMYGKKPNLGEILRWRSWPLRAARASISTSS